MSASPTIGPHRCRPHPPATRSRRAGDVDAYDYLLTADFTGVGPVGFVLTSEQWAKRHLGDLHNEKFEVLDPHVRIFGDPPDAAVVEAVVDVLRGEDMEQLVSASPAPGSFGALLRACRHRAYLSQEQLAAQAELSERTVRNLEAGRVRSPRTDTVRLLADALQLSEPDRDSWFAVAKGVNHQRTPTAGRRPDDASTQPALTARHRATRSGGQLTSADQQELARLRRECHRLRIEVETLKRATAIFAMAAPQGRSGSRVHQPT